MRCGLSPSAWRSRSVGSTSVRSASLRMAELRSGGWMRWTSLRSDHRIHPPTLRIRHPPLSFTLSVHPPSLGQRAVSGTATQSRAFLCGVGYALRLPPSSLPPCSKCRSRLRRSLVAAATLPPGVLLACESPPLPHPYKGIVGSPLFRFRAHCRGLPPIPLYPCALPPRGGLPYA